MLTLIIISYIIFSIDALETSDYLYYIDGKMNEGGILTLDAQGATNTSNIPEKKVKYSSYSRFNKYLSASQGKFYQKKLDLQHITTEKTSEPLNQSEINCKVISHIHQLGLYGLIGFAYKALHLKSNYAPSITYMIKSGPSKVTYINVAEGLEQQFQDEDIVQSCDSFDAINYLSTALYYDGFTSSECFPNDALPDQNLKCADGKEVSKMLKKYYIAQFREMKSKDVKNLLIRFGAVLVNDMIYVGWDKKDDNYYWISAVRKPLEYKYDAAEVLIDDNILYNGYVIIKSWHATIGLILGIAFGMSQLLPRYYVLLQAMLYLLLFLLFMLPIPEQSLAPVGPPVYATPSTQSDTNPNAIQQPHVPYPTTFTTTPERNQYDYEY
ncbi:MAG: hypothetical protein EZS28_004359 [Streblomastix strix]|uniref:Uncharacterized protein n=1 Tax=Streblomastix strix TaxID=222440 RepID=A0A5J4WZ15_9EUKA|nr:MAG: hypothetical protein EZS28_004359 [Streblomastix strix]